MKKSIIKIYQEQQKLLLRLQRIQNKCKHPSAIKVYGGDTGNYDPSNDCYWTDFHCPDCNKKWRENK
jgi:hypothetical protein